MVWLNSGKLSPPPPPPHPAPASAPDYFHNVGPIVDNEFIVLKVGLFSLQPYTFSVSRALNRFPLFGAYLSSTYTALRRNVTLHFFSRDFTHNHYNLLGVSYGTW